MKTAADWKKLYNGSFELEYEYDGILGARCSDAGTDFYLWSPVAEEVILYLYENAYLDNVKKEVLMAKQEHGVWHCFEEGKLHGTYYDFQLLIDGRRVRSSDPYAYGCGVNGRRSMVVDHAMVSPEGWEEDTAPPRQTDDIIYELHVKEFSWDESAGFELGHRGKYLAFTDQDVCVGQDTSRPAGVDYLKSLGVTHVQVMPMFDYASVDETGQQNQFNWGYDPLNFFVPEGSYSSDPYDGEVRIKEVKQMIMALHRAGLRVVMDVVFNHTWSFDNSLQHTVPWYYYRQFEDGRPSNGSGCGNDLASEKKMCAKLIKDCMVYWVKEYHIDGFRLDLMGLLGVELMNDIRKTFDGLYGEGEILMYGEPWAAAQTVIDCHYLLATKNNLLKLDKNVGFFCDDIRDLVKGSAWHPKEAGFVNGGRGLEKSILDCLEGFGLPASQIITYVSCHDNQTLWDKLTETTEYEVLRRKEYVLAAVLYMCCPGRMFFLSGEEFLRTKDGYSNTYNAPIYLNRLDWKMTDREAGFVDFYRGLIKLRKQLWCFYDKGIRKFAEGEKVIAENGVVAVVLDNSLSPEECRWNAVYMIFNRRQSAVELALPDGEWEQLLNGKDSFLWERHPAVQDKKLHVPPVNAVLLGRVKEAK